MVAASWFLRLVVRRCSGLCCVNGFGHVTGAQNTEIGYSRVSSSGASWQVTMQEMLREYLMKGKVEKIQPLGSSWLGPHGLAASLPMPRIVNQGLARVYLRKDTAGPEVVTINLGRPEAFETRLGTAGQLWRPSCLQSCDSTWSQGMCKMSLVFHSWSTFQSSTSMSFSARICSGTVLLKN